MANNRDVELVVRVKDETERAAKKITESLRAMSAAQEDVAQSGQPVSNVLASLSKELTGLDTKLKALAELKRVATQLDAASSAFSRLQGEVTSASTDLSRLEQDSLQAAQAQQALAAAAQVASAAFKNQKQASAAAKAEQTAVSAEVRKVERSYDTLAAAVANAKKPTQEMTKALQEKATALSALKAKQDGIKATYAAQSAIEKSLKTEAEGAAAALRSNENTQGKLKSATEAASTALAAQVTRLQQTETQLNQIKTAAQQAGAALGLVNVNGGSVDAAIGSTSRQKKDTSGVAAFRAEANANAEAVKQASVIAQRTEYERMYADALDKREANEREAVNTERRMTEGVAALRTQLDPLAASQARANARLVEYQTYLKSGKITADEFTAAEARLKAETDAVAASLDRASKGGGKAGGNGTVAFGLRPYELTNLSYQINDVVTQLASGTNATQVFAQQGGQIFQIFGRQLQTLMPKLAAVAPELIAAGFALVTFGLGVARAFEKANLIKDFNVELASMATQTIYTGQGLAAAANRMREFGLKTEEAKAAVKTFTKDGLDPAMLVKFGATAKNVSDVLGIDVPEAAKLLSAGMTGGYEAVKKLDDQFDFLTAAERENIRAMFDSGRAQDARRAAFDLFYAKMDNASKMSKGPWATAITELGRAWTSFIDKLANSAIIENTVRLLTLMAKAASAVAGALPGSERATLSASEGGTVGGTGGVGGSTAPRGQSLVQRRAPETALEKLVGPEQFGKWVESIIITPQIRDVVKTAMFEAKGVEGQRAVANVVLNRADRSGKSASDVVRAPGQFEPWNNPATRSRMDAVKDTDPKFIAALANIAPVLERLIPDNTGGAVNFYSPKAQNDLSRQDGRSTTPGEGALSFAKPELRTAFLGGNQFFKGTFPGDRPNAPAAPSGITTQTSAQTKAGDDYLRNQREQLQVTKDLTNAERVRQAGIKALEAAQNASPKLSDAAALQAKANAEAAERAVIAKEQEAAATQALGVLNQSNSEASRAQTQSLEARLAAIDASTKEKIAALDKLAKDNELTSLPGGKTVGGARADISANGEILKQQETMKFYDEELNALIKKRADLLLDIQNKIESGALLPQDGLAQISKTTEEFKPKFEALAAKAAEFGKSLSQAQLTPEVAAFLSKAATAGGDSIATANKASIKEFGDAVNGLLTQRAAAKADIDAQLKSQSIDAGEAFRQAQAIQDKFNPGIAKMAEDAAAFAASIAGTNPSPEMLAFIEKMKTIRGEAAPGSGGPASNSGGIAADVGQSGATQQQQALNDLLAARNALIAQNNALVDQGKMTQQQANDANFAAYQGTQPLIDAHIAKMRELLDVMLQQKAISQGTYDSMTASLKTTSLEAAGANQNFLQMKNTLNTSFVNGVAGAFDRFAQSVANGGNAFKSARDAFLQFASDFLRQIAQMIMQQALLSALSGIGAGGGPGAGIANFLTKALTRHSGGMVHGGGASRQVSPAWFNNAVRYHSGGVAGLRPNEIPTVLERGEEVLTANDPRHRNNGGMGGGGSPKINVINAIDSGDFVSKGVATPAGEKAIMNFMRANSRAIKSALG